VERSPPWPEVVLMELRMPRLDGVEATKRIRAEHPETQVVVLTTDADHESIVGALRAGAIGYRTKDVGRDHIGATITLDRVQMRRASRAIVETRRGKHTANNVPTSSETLMNTACRVRLPAPHSAYHTRDAVGLVR
jgi:DNA-binding NarL/FixJ family response regulator